MNPRQPASGVPSDGMYNPRQLLFPGGGLVMGTLPGGSKPVMARGAGSRIWDNRGRQYLDCVLGSGALILGHAHPEMVAAGVSRQIGEGTTYYALSSPTLELAERIVHHVPSAEQIQFCGSGGEAVGYALRLARAATGRQLVLKFRRRLSWLQRLCLDELGPLRPLPISGPPARHRRSSPRSVRHGIGSSV